MSTDKIAQYGWTAVPRSENTLFKTTTLKSPPDPLTVADIDFPASPLIEAIHDYAQKRLPKETFNHSLRVYYYGRAIHQQHFPQWKFTAETYLLCSLLHDIGTTPENIHATLMSFEFYGGILARDVVSAAGGEKELSEAVCEAVIRHQDLGETGTITAVGKLLHLATIFDNMGQFENLVHKKTIESVVDKYPRLGWSGCFAKTIRQENTLKPWAHTTALGEEDFPNGVANNKLMAPYD